MKQNIVVNLSLWRPDKDKNNINNFSKIRGNENCSIDQVKSIFKRVTFLTFLDTNNGDRGCNNPFTLNFYPVL